MTNASFQEVRERPYDVLKNVVWADYDLRYLTWNINSWFYACSVDSKSKFPTAEDRLDLAIFIMDLCLLVEANFFFFKYKFDILEWPELKEKSYWDKVDYKGLYWADKTYICDPSLIIKTFTLKYSWETVNRYMYHAELSLKSYKGPLSIVRDHEQIEVIRGLVLLVAESSYVIAFNEHFELDGSKALPLNQSN